MVPKIPVWVAFAAIIAHSATSTHAQAEVKQPAFVSKVGGKGVTLSSGTKKVPIQVQTLLASGDRVTASEGSFVEVTYLADGCIVRAANGRSITVSGASPCAAAETPKVDDQALAQQAASTDSQSNIEPAATDTVPAEVTEVRGPVARANLGEGLVDVGVGQMLKEGDTVFAGQNSAVTLYFLDPKCYYTVEAETYFTITDDPPCRRAAALPLALGAAALGAGGLAVVLLDDDDDDDDDEDRPVTAD
jgi:hypothetical protein